MSNYHGRRAPNVSQYLRELNTIQPATTAAPEENFSFEEDLAMFTNTQFFDFDSGQNTDYQSHPAKPDSETTRPEDPVSTAAASTTTTMDEFSSIDFMSTGEFDFSDFGAPYTSPTLQSYPDSITLQPVQPNPQSVYPVPPQARQTQQQPNGYRAPPPPRIGDKSRSPESPTSSNRPLSFEEASRLAAEEDKRRRNTAASARFRIKKKQREQALEKSAKEMNEKVVQLEGRISQLETENKWLKNLVMEKNPGNEDIANLWKEFRARQQAGIDGESGNEAAKKPVPTSPEEHDAGDMTG